MNPTGSLEARAGRRERDTLKESEGVLALFRTLLVAVALLAPSVLVSPPRVGSRFYIIAGLAAAYSVAITLLVWRGARWTWQRPLTLLLDIVLLTALIFYGGGLYGGLFPLYYLAVIAGAIWFNVAGAVASAALATLAYAVALMLTSPHNLLLFDLRDLMMPHALLLFLAALLCAYLAEAWRTEMAQAEQHRAVVEQFRQQMDMAQELQALILPDELPTVPGLDFGVRARQAAVVVGGDYYDALTFADGAVAVCCADVSGKSVPGQLRLPLVKYAFRVCAQHFREPVRVLGHLNNLLYDELPPEMLVSMVYVLVRPDRSGITLANAGHCRPLRWIAASGQVEVIETGGVVLGVERYLTYEATEVPFGPDDYLVLYSDGVIEAQDRRGNMLEVTGLARLLAEATPESAQDLANWLFAAIDEYEAGAKRDDLTILVIRRAGGD